MLKVKNKQSGKRYYGVAARSRQRLLWFRCVPDAIVILAKESGPCQSKRPAVCLFVALSVIYCVCYTYVWQKCCHTFVWLFRSWPSPFIWPACGLHCGPLARTGRQQGLRIWTLLDHWQCHRALPVPSTSFFSFFFASATIMIKPWQILLSCFSFVDSESNRSLQLNLCSQPGTLTAVWSSSDLSMEIKGNCKSTKVSD